MMSEEAIHLLLRIEKLSLADRVWLLEGVAATLRPMERFYESGMDKGIGGDGRRPGHPARNAAHRGRLPGPGGAGGGAARRTVRRGDIYFVDLDPVRGREQAGVRPAVILSVDDLNRLPLVLTIIPGTDGANVGRDYRSTVRVSAAESGLPLETVFLCFQIRAVDASRLAPQPAGRLSPASMVRIRTAIRYCLGV